VTGALVHDANSGQAGLYPPSSPASRDRATAWLREVTPSFRYSEYACDLMVFGDKNSSAPISGNDRCVASSGRKRHRERLPLEPESSPMTAASTSASAARALIVLAAGAGHP
jgi:hypothetical protein